MADGGGECCIARCGGGGHVAANGYSSSKMDMIMLKFRPIAPKPVSGTTTASEGGSSGTGSGSGSGSGRHAKAGGRGRKKTNKDNFINNNNNNNNNNRRKRKSSSPDRYDFGNIISDDFQDQKSDLTLLPLFPEAPDLSPTSQDQVQNMPFCLNFDNNNSTSNNNMCNKSGGSPSFEGNYNNCHVSW